MALGMDPSTVKAASDCIRSGSVDGCAQAGAVMACTAGCAAATVAFTAGSLTPLCGALSSLVVGAVWPILSSLVGAVYEGLKDLINAGLEALGLKDGPEFGDVEVEMRKQVQDLFEPAIAKASQAIADGVMKSRAAIGMTGNWVINIPEGMQGGGQFSFMSLPRAAEWLIWLSLASDPGFFAGWRRTSEYGTITMRELPQRPDGLLNINSAQAYESLASVWDLHWDYYWKRDDAFKWAADTLQEFYNLRLKALKQAIETATIGMMSIEAINPQTKEAMAANGGYHIKSLSYSGGIADTGSSVVGTVITVGILAMAGVGGWYLWTHRKK